MLIGGQGDALLRTREGKDMESRESGLRRKQPGQRTRAGTELVSGEQCVSRPEATCPEWTGRWAVTVIPFISKGRETLAKTVNFG